MCELDDLLDFGGTTGEAVKNGVEVSTLLHSNNSKLILFVNPDKEGLVFVVEDTTTVWPVTVKVAGLEETISFPKANCCYDMFFFVTVKILKKDSVTYLKRKWSSMSCLR